MVMVLQIVKGQSSAQNPLDQWGIAGASSIVRRQRQKEVLFEMQRSVSE